jgi:glucose/arabinose dehydrogenase
MTARHGYRFARILLAAAISVHSLAPVALAQLRAEVYVTGLSRPVAFVQDPSNANVQYVVEQGGRIRVVNGGVLASADFMNLGPPLAPPQISCCGERGLLGLAFPPDYATSGRFYVNFTNPQGNLVVARFERSANPLVADPGTRFDFLWPGGNRFIDHSTNGNHNGGTLVFGPDGYLYYGVGDGGGSNDVPHNAQNPLVLLGKMLRLDVNVPDEDLEGYDIPPDNPFVDSVPVAARHEIWAFGLRNPWKFSFDNPARGGTGALVIGDVGQNHWEEIDYEPAGQGGRNYGWRNFEGRHINPIPDPILPLAYQPKTDPIFEYSHGDGISITGGYVYRGMALSANAYRGRYFFADLSGRVWSIRLTINGAGEATASDQLEHTTELGGSDALGFISSFGEDARGELYVLSYTLGKILRISPPRAQLTSSASFPATWGSPSTWTATSSSGTPPLQYQFWRLKQNGGWVLVQRYSANNTYTWTPGPSEGGTYFLQVWVRSAGSTATYETRGSTPSFDILGAPPLNISAFSVNRTFPSAAYVSITWTAVASGGNPPLRYQFWRFKQGTGWSLVQPYSALNTYLWTPTAADVGTYVLHVWVRSTGSTAAFDASRGTGNFEITGPSVVPELGSLAANVTFPAMVGNPMTWSAVVD